MFGLLGILNTPLKVAAGGGALAGGIGIGATGGTMWKPADYIGTPSEWSEWNVLGGGDNSDELSEIKIPSKVESWFIVFKPDMCKEVSDMNERIDVFGGGSGLHVLGKKFAGGHVVCFKIPYDGNGEIS